MSPSDFAQARAVFESRPDYAELIAEAQARGYRRISLSEQVHSPHAPDDVYLWRGGVWIKEPRAASSHTAA